MDSKELDQGKDSIYHDWQIDWLLSDALRSPSEAIAQVQKIAQQTGKSVAEATIEVAEELKVLSKRQEAV